MFEPETRRFSKSALLAQLEKRCDEMAAHNGFDPNDGWSQVWRDKGYKPDWLRAIAYGRFSLLQDLIEELSS